MNKPDWIDDLSFFPVKSPWIMGILNITPDSFSDGARFLATEVAIERALQMVEQGADIIDVGGESTRPGAESVSVSAELDRVIPVIEALVKQGIRVSIDTNKTAVMAAAIQAGVAMINDVNALRAEGAVELVAKYQVPVCLMHMQGMPQTMQSNPHYDSVVLDVFKFLKQRIEACESAGLSIDCISIDPGFGFGKRLAHNLSLLANLEQFVQLNVPILAGLSRKSMLGELTGRAVDDRLAASLAVAMIAMQKGARMIRVHDVKETVDLKKVFLAVENSI